MEITRTSIEGLVIIQPKVFEDERGYFMESFKESFIEENIPEVKFIQDNESKSNYGVLRGLHFQIPPYEQSKLVRVVEGEVLDVAVDLRKNSETFGKWESFILSSSNKKQLFIPKGFAHGFIVLSTQATFSYKVDEPFQPNYESGINYKDQTLGIDWKLPDDEIIVSKRDQLLKPLNNEIFRKLYK